MAVLAARYAPDVATTSVILVSDTHLSASAPHAQANWDAAVRYVGACAPDLVIHLGDLSQDGAHEVACGFSRVQQFTVALPAGEWPGTLLEMRLAARLSG